MLCPLMGMSPTRLIHMPNFGICRLPTLQLASSDLTVILILIRCAQQHRINLALHVPNFDDIFDPPHTLWPVPYSLFPRSCNQAMFTVAKSAPRARAECSPLIRLPSYMLPWGNKLNYWGSNMCTFADFCVLKRGEPTASCNRWTGLKGRGGEATQGGKLPAERVWMPPSSKPTN